MTNKISERQDRLKKLESIQKAGINPYPSKFEKKQLLAEAGEKKSGVKVDIAGRIIAKRTLGKIIFCRLQDQSGRLQAVLKQDEIGRKDFDFFRKNLDLGDFLGVTGKMFTTKRGEFSVLVKKYRLLTKALRPLPEKWHGLQDEELKLRKRYLDFITNPELKNLFIRKNFFWQTTRNFMEKLDFLEIETPILETSAGGAEAEPFVTRHQAFDLEVYLRISTGELWQKRLMVAGFEKTFEIGRQFRNEGVSREHLQDYSQMECYWAYADYQKMMNLVEKLIKEIVKKVYHRTKFTINGHQVDFSGSWKKIDYAETLSQKAKLNVLTASQKEIQKKLKKLKMEFSPKDGRGRLIDLLWKYFRSQFSGPVFLINHPTVISPLAKKHSDHPEKTQRFQLIVGGSELGNGYSELNDPIDQAERFQEQAALRAQGDTAAQMFDQDFVEALEYGMPPVAGFGFSERLFAFLENRPVRECQFFPLVKPKQQ